MKIRILLLLFALILVGCTKQVMSPTEVHSLKTFKISEPYPEPHIVAMQDNKWVLAEPLIVTYYNKHDSSETYTIVVPAGFVMDLASVPAGFRVLVGKYHDLDTAAIVHDYLFWAQPCEKEGNGKRIADKLYRDTLKESEHVHIVSAWGQWAVLKTASWKAWKDNRSDKKSGESRFMTKEYWTKITKQTKWSDIKNECCKHQQPLELNPPDKDICTIKPEKEE